MIERAKSSPLTRQPDFMHMSIPMNQLFSLWQGLPHGDLLKIAVIELERERVQLLFQVDPIVPDQLLNIALLISKPLCTMQSVLNMEPGKRLDLAAEVVDNCLSFHIGPSPACCGCVPLLSLPFWRGLYLCILPLFALSAHIPAVGIIIFSFICIISCGAPFPQHGILPKSVPVFCKYCQ